MYMGLAGTRWSRKTQEGPPRSGCLPLRVAGAGTVSVPVHTIGTCLRPRPLLDRLGYVRDQQDRAIWQQKLEPGLQESAGASRIAGGGVDEPGVKRCSLCGGRFGTVPMMHGAPGLPGRACLPFHREPSRRSP